MRLGLRRPITAIPLVVIFVFAIQAAITYRASAEEDTPADAMAYAEMDGITLDEAQFRIRVQEAAGAVEEALASLRPNTFAGLWLERRPVFRVVAAFTEDASAVLQQAVAGTALAPIVEHRLTTRSLRSLEADLASIEWLFHERMADLQIDVITNTVEVRVVSEERFRDFLTSRNANLPSSARVLEVGGLNTPAADIYGGLALTTCTSGLSVIKNGTADRGITTAAHCQNSQSYSGSSLPFQLESAGASHDEQWHLAPAFTVRNWVKDPNQGDGTRDITSKTYRSSQPIGGIVCKYGKMTGFDCGWITSKTSTGCMNGGATHVVVESNTGANLADPGDSGAATFSSNSAYGILSCIGGDGLDFIHVAVDYVESGLAVTILTTP